jgi:hypothetical protein
MPAPLAVDKEQVRMLVLSIGVRQAARQMGIAEGTVQDWSAAGKWLADTRPTPAKLPPPASMVSPTSPTKPADALRDVLSDDSRETRISLSKAARKLAKKAEEADLDQAGDVLQAAKTAALVHSWEQAGGSHMVINVALLGRSLPDAAT